MTTFGPEMSAYMQLATGVRRLVAPNPSIMTGPGTNTYLFGVDEVAVLDPGPVIDQHLEHIVEKSGAPIRWILVTHTHPDHSPAAKPLAEMTGAELLGRLAPQGDHQDETFSPDRVLADGDRLEVDGVEIEAIHTPGHASNHVCFRQTELNWIFTGDHVIDGSTVVINPPDGNIEALHRVVTAFENVRQRGSGARSRRSDSRSQPSDRLDSRSSARLREAKVLAGLKANPGLTSMELVPHVYKDVDPKLYGWAERSLLAHLIKLEDDGAARRDEDFWLA